MCSPKLHRAMIVGTGDWKGLRTCVVREDTFFQNCLSVFFLTLIYFVNFLFFQDAANSFAEHFFAKDPGKVSFYALNFQ